LNLNKNVKKILFLLPFPISIDPLQLSLFSPFALQIFLKPPYHRQAHPYIIKVN
jgi:hypothetical protein